METILFYISMIFVLFVPGYVLIWAVFGKKKFEMIERFVISLGLSIGILNFILFFIQKIGIQISKISIISSILIFIIVCLGIYFFRFRKKKEKSEDKLFKFSSKQFVLILLLIFLIFIIKTTYLSNTVIPTATDMGHHMYWAKMMSETGTLPNYDGMPDFIIGEHTFFSVINILSGSSYFSAFPVVILYLINIFSILAVFILTMRIFEKKNIAILALLFIGVLYAVSSPQAKYASGGVIGNILGNYLLPIIFYFYFRAFEFLKEKAKENIDSKIFLALAVFLTFTLFYTHHLSSFVFIFSFLLILILFLAINYKNLKEIFPKILRTVFSWQVISVLIFCLIFFFYIFTPTYVSPSAVDTAVGSPVKSTRTGLSLEDIRSTIGDPRIALGFAGLILLGFFYRKRNLGFSIVSAWAIMIFIMSVKPGWLFIDIPSNRIGNYITYPAAILAAYGFYAVLKNVKVNNLVRMGFFILTLFALIWGLREAAYSLKEVPSSSELTQTFAASEYLAERSNESEKVLKDHNYLVGDAWIKLFFGRGYKYPLSRSYFKRYEDPTKPREMCTLYMISNPNSEDGNNCFDETGVKFMMVNPEFDSGQFMRTDNFNWVYASSELGIFYKK